MEIAPRRREQEVWQACDDLWALSGDLKDLTGDAIRERLVTLGKSRGSPNEIYKYRKSWSLSRRLDSNGMSENSGEHDPITRVVRMVHEKLITEAEEKIQALQMAHESEIQKKDAQQEQLRSDLAQVIRELNISGDALNKSEAELVSLHQQLAAEIEIRKAQERELAFAKSSHQQTIQELKISHHDSCERLALVFNQAEHERLAHIERLETEQKRLGFEFSEKLTEIKTSNYNQALVIKNLEAQKGDLRWELEQKTSELKAQSIKLATTLEEYGRLKTAFEALNSQFSYLQSTQSITQKELSKAKISAKKQELTIARLRAQRAFG